MNRISAGIVLYNPDYDRLQKNVEAILPQVEKLYLCDNGSDNINALRFAFSRREDVVFIEFGENKGIAAALNKLCSMAAADGFDWIVTLDQDSVPYTDMVEQYLPYIDKENLALLAPNVDDDNENDMLRSTDLPDYEEIKRANTSGCLTSLFAWKEIDGFDERMFIDCVDFDFCTNLLKNGFIVARVNKACIHHLLGEAKQIRFFLKLGRIFNINSLKKVVYTYNHSPIRTYYYARNIKYYIYKHKDFIDVKKERRVYLKWLILKLFFEKHRFKKLKAVIKGRLDAKKLINEYKAELNQNKKTMGA